MCIVSLKPILTVMASGCFHLNPGRGYSFFILSKIFILILGPTQPLVSGYQDSFLWVKGMGHDTDHLPPPVCLHGLSYLHVRE